MKRTATIFAVLLAIALLAGCVPQEAPQEHAHTLTHTEGYPATCLDNGITENWFCLDCGKRFVDAEAAKEITFADIEIIAPGHTSAEDDGDCTTAINCTVCGEVAVAGKPHTGGTATCTQKAVCTACGTAYGELNPDNHTFVDGVCPCGRIENINATAMTADELKAVVAKALAAGQTDITVTLAADAPVEMFTAIRRALIDTEGVADGSINLTLKGVTTIPDHSDTLMLGNVFGEVVFDENDDVFEQPERVTQLASVNLPDVLTIGVRSFNGCENLRSFTAPKAQILWDWALAETSLISVELPQVTTVYSNAFNDCAELTTVKLPNVTYIENCGFGKTMSLVSVELTSAAVISAPYDFIDESCIENVNLVLYTNKQSQVSGNTWTPEDAYGNEQSITFKSITFACIDGTTNHSYAYTDNGDGTHSSTCQHCGFSTTEDHFGYMDENCQCEKCGIEHYLPHADEGDCWCLYCDEYIHNPDENCACTICSIQVHTVDSTTGICSVCNNFIAAASITVDGVKTYYSTFEEAIDYANGKDGVVIVIENDCNIMDAFLKISSGSIAIDLNGKTVDSVIGYTIPIDGATVTIRDSVGGGKTLETVGGWSGTLIIEGGTHNHVNNPKNLVITSGKFTSVGVNKGKTTISGGSFEQIAIHSNVGTLADMLADGYCFYDQDGNVVDVSTIQTDEYGWYNLNNITVGAIK